MEATSLTPQEEKLKALQAILPEAFAEGKIDWEKLKATLGEDINFSNERYVLNWAGKSDAFKVLQTPSSKTLIPCPEESVKNDGTNYQKGESFTIENQDNQENQINHGSDNIFIEGENLEVLKVLQKSYFGKVKMIYIDPPYNTGNDSFIYPDKFSETKAEYEKRVGDKDEEGYMTKSTQKFPSIEGVPQAGWSKNSKENGQYHSNWLSMMMPRLYLAKNLLTQDGVIFVSIDDNEIHNLRLLMNEIFGEENFVSEFVWQKNFAPKNDNKFISNSHEYILHFAKNKEFYKRNLLNREEKHNKDYKNPDNDINGNWTSGSVLATSFSQNGVFEIISPNGTKHLPPKGRCWRFSFEKFNELLKENRLWFGNDGNGVPRIKRYLSEMPDGIVPQTWLDYKLVGSGQDGTQTVKKLFEDSMYFDFPKPYSLIKHLTIIGSNSNDLILDFFAGSGTTAHAVMELNKEDGGNRKYICVQLPELCDSTSEAYKAGYKTIAEISKERIRRAGNLIVNGQLLIINEKKTVLEKLLNANTLIKDQERIDTLQTEINHLQLTINNYDSGFKVLKLADSNFKQWQQFPSAGGVPEGRGGKEEQTKALTEQMQLFIDPVAENATIENMVYEFLLKSGKDLNSKIEKKSPFSEGVAESRGSYYCINNSELILLLESVSQIIIEQVIAQKPMKVIALDKLFTNNDQLKTNTVLQMRDAGIEFKTV